MRIVGVLTAVAALFVSGAALAQDWGVYVMLFDLKDGNKVSISPIGAPALGWPDVSLELCPAIRG